MGVLPLKRRIWPLALALCLLLSACGVRPARAQEGRSRHTIDCLLSLSPGGAPRVEAAHRIVYTNGTGGTRTDVSLSLWASAYQTQQTAPFEPASFSDAYPQGFSAGGIDVRSVTADGVAAQTAMGNGPHMLVALPKPLPPGGTLTLELRYRLTLPCAQGRYGYGENTIKLLNAFPLIDPWDGAAWVQHPYGAVGDPFVSEVADFALRLRAPSDFRVCATGETVREENDAGVSAYLITAERVRDVGIVLSRDAGLARREVEGVCVLSVAPDDESAERALQTAVQSLQTFGGLAGAYPYKTYTVVAADFFIGGMEYPGLSVVDRGLYRESRAETLAFVVAHETAHQWFYALTGSDQTLRPWLDEALTQQLTLRYYELAQGKEGYERAVQRFVRPYIALAEQPGMPPVSAPLAEFADNVAYDAVVYEKGSLLLEELRAAMGAKRYDRFLHDYALAHRYQIATDKDFFAALARSAGKPAAERFARELGERP